MSLIKPLYFLARPNNQNGFTLIEVLITIIVLAMGLLGLAGMQAVAQRANHTAYLRSQAAMQAYDIADRMRANLPGVTAGAYNSISGIQIASNCESTMCIPTDMAKYDAQQWNTANAALFPSGQGTVVSNGDSTFTITISWDDNRDGTVDDNDVRFATIFRP